MATLGNLSTMSLQYFLQTRKITVMVIEENAETGDEKPSSI
ncbi:hypothetical protein QF042_004555 [Pedobacter sp. W3I1]|nr:hypothetical protein [Pedobacter sp. W3I1]